MKSILLISLLFLIFFASGIYHGSAQLTRTSQANGDFLSASTWDCNCIPMPWDIIIINHDVVLDTNWYTSVSFTITPGSSLIENAVRNFAVYSGSFINNGTVDISRFALWSGSVINNDSMRVDWSLYLDGTFENHDQLADVDSLSNFGILKNLSGAVIEGNLFSNLDSLVNEGTITMNGHTNTSSGRSYNSGTLDFTDFTNAGIAYNSETLLFNDFTNAVTGSYYNSATITGTRDFWNGGYFSNLASGNMSVARDWANGSGDTTNWALFLNNGFVYVGNDWANYDSVSGGATGQFCIEDSTFNSGMMAGSYDFCDKTPPLSQPFIDFNIGTIRPGITWCAKSCNIGIAETGGEDGEIVVYPNPNNGKFIIEIRNTESRSQNPEVEIQISELRIVDVFAQEVFKTPVFDVKSEISLESLPVGIYFYSVINSGEIIHAGKFIVE